MDPCYIYTIKRYPENLVWSSKFDKWITHSNELGKYKRLYYIKALATSQAQKLYTLKNHFVLNDTVYDVIQLKNTEFDIVICENVLIPSYEKIIKPNESREY